MTNEELNTALYKKVFEEQEEYKNWLRSQDPETILQHSYEYASREDILLSLEYYDLNDAHARALLDSDSPLKEAFEIFQQRDTNYLEEVFSSLESAAESLIREKQLADLVPLYTQSATYARDNGELDAYRASHKANVACKEAIEDAIRDHYHDNRLDVACIKPIIERFGIDRVEYVLANTLQHKDWDERFSSSNRAWAKTIPIAQDGNDFIGDRRTAFVVDRSHSGLTDLFVTAFRKEKQRILDSSQRMSIYEQLRQPVPQTNSLKKAKADSKER